MHLKTLVACAALAQGLAALGSSAAMARTVTFGFSGNFGYGVGAYSGQATLDVVGGQAVSGNGFITDRKLGYSKAPIVLITPSTPGNDPAPSDGTVGFADDVGDVLQGADTVYPIDGGGLLFDMGTTVAQSGKYRLFGIYAGAGQHPWQVSLTASNVTLDTGAVSKGLGSLFSGSVPGLPGPVMILGSALPLHRHKVAAALDAFTPVPEPATWATMLIGLAGLGFAGRRRARKALSGGVIDFARPGSRSGSGRHRRR
jgi:hypothetical protein